MKRGLPLAHVPIGRTTKIVPPDPRRIGGEKRPGGVNGAQYCRRASTRAIGRCLAGGDIDASPPPDNKRAIGLLAEAVPPILDDDDNDDTKLPGDTHAEFIEFLVVLPGSCVVGGGIVPSPSGASRVLPPPPLASEATIGMTNIEMLLPARLIKEGEA